jgi:hypothetical protein
MKISRKLPQFEGVPTLLLVSGEFEARFFVAQDGEIVERNVIKHIPREETIGKDWGFTKGSSATPSSGAVSAHGERTLNLRRRFQEEVASLANEMVTYGEVLQIYLFAPSYVTPQILRHLEQHARRKVIDTFDGEYVKEGPLRALELIARASENNDANRP